MPRDPRYVEAVMSIAETLESLDTAQRKIGPYVGIGICLALGWVSIEPTIAGIKALKERKNPAERALLGTLIGASSIGLIISGYGLCKFVPQIFM